MKNFINLKFAVYLRLFYFKKVSEKVAGINSAAVQLDFSRALSKKCGHVPGTLTRKVKFGID